MSITNRLATGYVYENAVAHLATRQAGLSRLQDQLSASKKILRPSDDPTGAAQAERATTRMARVATDQRGLELARNAVIDVESTLGDAVRAVQDFRTLVVQAGNGGLSGTDRASLAQQLVSLRNELFAHANRVDSNGQPLFGGLGSSSMPFIDASGGVVFDGIAGQVANGAASVAPVADGNATWMQVPTGNGVFTVAQDAGTAAVWSDVGQVSDPSLVTGHAYRIEFNLVGNAMTYDVVDTTTSTTLQAAQPYTDGQAIAFDGLRLAVHGQPATGNALVLAPSTRTSLFGVLDQAIADVRSAGTGAELAQNIGRALVQIDAGAQRLSSSRAHAGDLLNQADNITSRQETRSMQLEADRSRAEDLDVVKAISDFQNQQTAYSAALASYAQIQKLSLFNFIN
ncbi:MAG: flagellar hook-associated protein FlgL [Variovorax sp.]